MSHLGTVLVINSGSSSIKYQLIDPHNKTSIASGLVENIGESVAGRYVHKHGENETVVEELVPNHHVGLRKVLDLFHTSGPDLKEAGIVAVGHRIVQGGAIFSHPELVTDQVVAQINELSSLAPLHNPGHVAGIEVARELLPDVPHVVVFDTAFFTTLPQAAYTYALDPQIANKYGIRRYGFHGTSHEYVSERTAALLGEQFGKTPAEINQIVLHLGNGASASAVRGGKAVETSMGLTPLEGLVMGTRTGDIDPAVVFYLLDKGELKPEELNDFFNKKSGLKALAGQNDFRELHEMIAAGSSEAKLALDVYIHRLRKYIGAYTAVLGRVDAITFTAGVGENDDIVRALALADLEDFGIKIDLEKNAGRKKQETLISTPDSRVKVYVVPTNEELAIAQKAISLI